MAPPAGRARLPSRKSSGAPGRVLRHAPVQLLPGDCAAAAPTAVMAKRLMSGSARTSSPCRGRSPAAELSLLQRPEREGVGAAPRVSLLGGRGLGEEGSAG